MKNEKTITVRLIFAGERFVSLPKIAELLNDAIAPRPAMTMQEVTLTSLRLCNDRLSVLLDITFEGFDTILSLSLQSQAADPTRELAALTYSLASRVAVNQIVWPGSDVRIPRDRFLETLSDIFGARGKAGESVAPRRIGRPTDKVVPMRPRAAEAPIVTPQARVDRYAASLGGVRGNDRRYDAHVLAYEAQLRDTLRGDGLRTIFEGTGREQPAEVRLAAWAMSLSAAVISLPVAVPVMAYSLVKGEDMRAAALSVGLAGFFFALDHSGTMAMAF